MRAHYLKTILSGLCFLIICGIVAGKKNNKAHGHSKKSRGCGGGTDRIVGGRVAGVGEFPYQVSIRVADAPWCGGSVISNKWILTSARCIYSIQRTNITVVVGTNSLQDEESNGEGYLISTVIYHEEYSEHDNLNDIGLLETSETIELTNLIAVVPLSNDYPPEGSTATLTGWGFTGTDEARSDPLKAVNLKTITLAQCNASRMANEDGPVPTSCLCTAGVTGEGGCNDNGGPLVLSGSQIGVYGGNYERPCANGQPDVFASVSYHRSWIKSNSGV